MYDQPLSSSSTLTIHVVLSANTLLHYEHTIHVLTETAIFVLHYVTMQDIWFDPCDSNRGYLSQKLNTMRRNLPRNELMRPRMKEGGDKISTSATTKTTKRKYTPLKEIPPLEEEELMLFCKRASRHETKGILEAMATSHSNRRNWITLKAPSVPEILARYPRLQDSPAVVKLNIRACHGVLHIICWTPPPFPPPPPANQSF